jgi:hypothetical protein
MLGQLGQNYVGVIFFTKYIYIYRNYKKKIIKNN